jgi:triacylglycerol lipase
MSSIHSVNVLLVPGFFGFGRLGDIDYFAGVRPLLEQALLRHGIEARVAEVITPPTASIRQRAARVLEALVDVARSPGDIHIVGHSTGGLDARLAIAQTASLPTTARLADYGRVRSVVSISCPHYGTNVSTYFTRPFGRALFRITARYLAFMLERDRLPLKLLLRLGYLTLRLTDPRRRRRGTFDQVYERLFNDLSEQRRAELCQFLRQIAAEQALLFQLTPAGCDLLNACTLDPPVAYGSVIACAEPPHFRSLLRAVVSLYAQLMYPLYWVLHRLSREKDDALRTQFSAPQLAAVDAGLGRPASFRDSDGIVPVLSQVWGRVLHVTHADHLDVVGQYGARGDETWGGDWIPSVSGFDAEKFEALWSAVAAFVAESSRALCVDSEATAPPVK